MKHIKLSAIGIGIISMLAMTTLAFAEEISIKGHNHDQVQGKCSGDGDVYWVEGKTGHTYGCMHEDGSGIVCGGVSPKQKKTCSTFREATFPKIQVPTRAGAGETRSP